MPVRGGRLNVDAALPMKVPSGDGAVGRVVDKKLLTIDMEEARPVCRGEMLGGKNRFGRSVSDDSAGEKDDVFGDPGFGEVVGSHHHGAAGCVLIVDDVVYCPGRRDV